MADTTDIAINKPAVTARTFTNRVKCTWPVVEGVVSGSGWDSASIEGYTIYEGGNLIWSCGGDDCTARYTGSHPATCSRCGFHGLGWKWNITNYATHSFVSGTSYISLVDAANPGDSNVYIAARGTCYQDMGGGDYWSTYPCYSEPFTVTRSLGGSYIATGSSNVSLITASSMIEYGTHYTSDRDASLNNSVYNGNLNPFSKILPGYQQKLQVDAYEDMYDFYRTLKSGSAEPTWNISGSDNRDFSKSASLSSFRGYTDGYYAGVSGSVWYFPWGFLSFAQGSLDPVEGINTSAARNASISIWMFGNYMSAYSSVDIDSYYGRRSNSDTLSIKVLGSTGSGPYGIATNTHLYPGVLIWNNTTTGIKIRAWRSSTALGSTNLSTTNVLQLASFNIPSSFTDVTSGSRLYPILVYNPYSETFGPSSWKTLYSGSSYSTPGDFIITFDDNYLPISI